MRDGPLGGDGRVRRPAAINAIDSLKRRVDLASTEQFRSVRRARTGHPGQRPASLAIGGRSSSHAGCSLSKGHRGVCPGSCGRSASTPVGEQEGVLVARRRGDGQLAQARWQAVQDFGARRHRLAQRQGPEGAEARQAQGLVSRPLGTVAGHPDALQLLQRVARRLQLVLRSK